MGGLPPKTAVQRTRSPVSMRATIWATRQGHWL